MLTDVNQLCELVATCYVLVSPRWTAHGRESLDPGCHMISRRSLQIPSTTAKRKSLEMHRFLTYTATVPCEKRTRCLYEIPSDQLATTTLRGLTCQFRATHKAQRDLWRVRVP